MSPSSCRGRRLLDCQGTSAICTARACAIAQSFAPASPRSPGLADCPGRAVRAGTAVRANASIRLEARSLPGRPFLFCLWRPAVTAATAAWARAVLSQQGCRQRAQQQGRQHNSEYRFAFHFRPYFFDLYFLDRRSCCRRSINNRPDADENARR